MLKTSSFSKTGKLLGLAAGVSLFLLASYGCQDSAASQGRPMPGSTAASGHPAKGGAELWSDNCMRCHNLRPPTQYSNAQWQIIMHHMRVRADLTGEEQRKILEFIQSANLH